jgi:hypothetical protein
MKKLFFLLIFVLPFLLKAQTKIDTFKVNYTQKINKDTSRLKLEYTNGTKFDFWAIGKGPHNFKIGDQIRMQRAPTERKNPFVIIYRDNSYTLKPYQPIAINRR